MEQYRVFWEESFDRLEAYLVTVTTEQRRATPVNANDESFQPRGPKAKSPTIRRGKRKGKQHGRKK
jgi:hypothetical protein